MASKQTLFAGIHNITIAGHGEDNDFIGVFFSTIQTETEVCEVEEEAMSIDFLVNERESPPQIDQHTDHEWSPRSIIRHTGLKVVTAIDERYEAKKIVEESV